MAWRPKNLSDALLPMIILYAVIGHGIFQYPIGRQRVTISRAYALITGFLYYSALVFNLLFVGKPKWSTTRNIVLNIVAISHYVIAFFTQINNWYHAKTFLRILKKLTKVDETLRKLGANINYRTTMNTGIVVIIWWLIAIVGENLIAASDPRWKKYSYSWFNKIFYFTIINHAMQVNAIIPLNFAMALRILESRFYKVNELIEDSLNSYYRKPRVDPWSFSDCRKINVNPTLGVSSRRLWYTEENLKSLIQTVKHVHLELIHVSEYHNKIYGLPMVLETTSFFVSFTGLVYNLFEIITIPELPSREHRISSLAVWILVGFTNFMFIHRSSDSVRTEAERTGIIIRGIDSTIGDSEFHDEIKQFSLQILKNSMCFSPAGFFDIGYSFVLMFINAVITYVMILIQSDYNT